MNDINVLNAKHLTIPNNGIRVDCESTMEFEYRFRAHPIIQSVIIFKFSGLCLGVLPLFQPLSPDWN